jgi:hypothetical protein
MKICPVRAEFSMQTDTTTGEYRLGPEMNYTEMTVQFLPRVKDFSFNQSIQTGYEAHPASYSMDN